MLVPLVLGSLVGTFAGVVLLTTILVPAALGSVVGLDGILGISVLGLIASFDNSNGGPFFSLLLLGASGLGESPLLSLAAALVPFLPGMLVGNLDSVGREVLRPVPNMFIPLFAVALGTGTDLEAVVTGGLSGLLVGVGVTLTTGTFVHVGHTLLLRGGRRSGVGIAAAADPTSAPYVGTATARVAASVLVTANLTPLLASFALRRAVPLGPFDESDSEAGDEASDEAGGVAGAARADGAPAAGAR